MAYTGGQTWIGPRSSMCRGRRWQGQGIHDPLVLANDGVGQVLFELGRQHIPGIGLDLQDASIAAALHLVEGALDPIARGAEDSIPLNKQRRMEMNRPLRGLRF